MKTNRQLKWIAITLAALTLLQSCKVYHGNTVTQEEALITAKRVMVKNFNDKAYKFDRLLIEEGQLYGITKRRSATAKLLNEQIVNGNLDAKYVKILLPEDSIRAYHLQNRTMSTLITVLIPVALIASLALIPTQRTKSVDLDLRL